MHVASFFGGLMMTIGSWFGAGQNLPPPPPFQAPNHMASASSTISAHTQTFSYSGTVSATVQTGPAASVVSAGSFALGDGKYVTDGPKKGYVYLCHVMPDGQGAQADGPWIQGTSWNPSQKVSVQGKVSWPQAYVHTTISGSTRIIASNDLPLNGYTGTFPIAATDPAHAYDSNPNSIQAQNLSFSLPLNPAFASAPQCIDGEVGIMTNGVLLLDAFDAEYRDAPAHEVQDSCDGHPHEGGMYHYHSLSSCIPNATATTIIGWAFDGFPITGPQLASGKNLTTADLDECHGTTSLIMENGTLVSQYHYVMTSDFPYSVGCFMGTSHEPKPAQQGSSGSMNMNGENSGASPGMNGSAQATQANQPPTPPAAAITACAGSSNGSACLFSTPQQQISGICRMPPGQTALACVPQLH